MPLYSARPPLTPPRILSVRLRRSCGRAGGPGGGGGGGCQAGGSSGGGLGGGAAGGAAVVMAGSLPTSAGQDHQGRPPSDPGSGAGVITGVGRGGCGATIVTVTTTATGAPPRVTAPRPPLVRPRSGRLLAGVATGTASHLRMDPLIVRVAFAVLATTGIGIVVYGLLWLTMPVAAPGEEPAPGRVELGPGTGRRQLLILVALGLAASAAIGQVVQTGGALLLPLILVAAGLAVVWRQLDADRTLAVPGVRWALAGGVVLAAGGVVLLLATTGQLANARNGFAATLVILIGVVLVTAPIWRRLLDSRAEERTARIRSEERAAVAAHLHDSVRPPARPCSTPPSTPAPPPPTCTPR